MYNAVPGERNKKSVQIWAEQSFPEIWAELERVPIVQHKEDGYDMFDIKREWKA